MKKGKKRSIIFLLTILITVNFVSMQADASAEKSDFVVIVDECAATTASVKLQNEPAEYVLSDHTEYAAAEPEAESIEWRPFYGAFGAIIAVGAGTICILIARSRKRDQKVIGKRGL